jgi:hypothetical protein
MERMLLADAGASNNDTAPFFGFIGAAAALVFSCERLPGPRRLTNACRPPSIAAPRRRPAAAAATHQAWPACRQPAVPRARRACWAPARE